MVLSEVLAREQQLGRELAAQKVEVARGQCCETFEAEGMKKPREERNGPRAEAEDDAGIAWVERQGGGGGGAYVEGIGTIAVDSAENTLASAAPSVDGSIDNLVVA
jgi:hypothetical protein